MGQQGSTTMATTRATPPLRSGGTLLRKHKHVLTWTIISRLLALTTAGGLGSNRVLAAAASAALATDTGAALGAALAARLLWLPGPRHRRGARIRSGSLAATGTCFGVTVSGFTRSPMLPSGGSPFRSGLPLPLLVFTMSFSVCSSRRSCKSPSLRSTSMATSNLPLPPTWPPPETDTCHALNWLKSTS